MEVTFGLILSSMVVVASLTWAVKLLNMFWLRPRKIEKFLREQGLSGNPYKLIVGDMKDFMKCMNEEEPKSFEISDAHMPHVVPYEHRIISKYGANCFYWLGPWARLAVTDPELIKEIVRRYDVFARPFPELNRILGVAGILCVEGQEWVKRRKILDHAFHLDKLKNMAPVMGLSCSIMIQKLKAAVASSSELDIWPFIEDLTGDVISRVAFGSSYEQGTRVFELIRQRVDLTMPLLQFFYLPGFRYLPTKSNRKVKALSTEMQSILRGVIEQREKATPKDDLLGILLEANSRFIQQEGGMSIEDVIEECELFYLSGSKTVASLLVWTVVMLCSYPEWQTQAREEVNRVFGNSEPALQGLHHLKIVTMILQEVLRLYPTSPVIYRSSKEEVKIGSLTIPAGMHLSLLIGLFQTDPKIWGDDANKFNPERFAQGVAKATDNQPVFTPFSSGPRMCIGHNFAMIEAKLAIATLLQHFSFQLSPSYKHAPFSLYKLRPQYGAPLILRPLH
ncbi:cytochrome P450 CYP72A219-like [Salvia miltiorrhiza]|uniref:cytochrome P450 CYP72A219-like n=1 Tax=Salvia miltiorrhiza TaxID=226208 RepID=UPI0025AD5F5E|nr:cytochrome P450 CYP72A219-like [Salvia miltiorrhiza]